MNHEWVTGNCTLVIRAFCIWNFLQGCVNSTWCREFSVCVCDSVIVYSLQRWGCNHIQRNRNGESMRGLSFNSLVLYGCCSWLDLRFSLLCCPSSLVPLNRCLLEREWRRIKSNYSIIYIYILKILKITLHCKIHCYWQKKSV